MIYPTLLMSCAHYGKETPTYNVGVLEHRFEKLTRVLVDTCKSLGSDVEELTVVNAGDNNDGAMIYDNQEAHQDEQDPLLQVDPMLDTLIDLSEIVHDETGVRVKWHCVAGNHGRISHHVHEQANWDILLYRLMQREAQRLDWLEVNIGSPEKEDMFLRKFNIDGVSCIAYHGSSIKSYSGFPRYGINRRVQNWLTSKPFRFCQYVFLGHFHTCEYFPINDHAVYVTGTMVSDDGWALEKLGYQSVPQWWLLFFENGRVIAEQRVELS